MKQTSNTVPRAVLRRPLAVLVIAVGLVVAGCANDPNTAPGTPSTGGPPAATLSWARSMCQALHPTFDQLGALPPADSGNPETTRQAYVIYLTNTRNATQQTIDRLSSIEAPPMKNGQQIVDQIRNQLIQFRDNLNEASARLNQANPNLAGAIERAFGAAGNVVRLFGTLTTDPQIRAAINQTPECQNLAGADGPSSTNQPTRSQPPR